MTAKNGQTEMWDVIGWIGLAAILGIVVVVGMYLTTQADINKPCVERASDTEGG